MPSLKIHKKLKVGQCGESPEVQAALSLLESNVRARPLNTDVIYNVEGEFGEKVLDLSKAEKIVGSFLDNDLAVNEGREESEIKTRYSQLRSRLKTALQK